MSHSFGVAIESLVAILLLLLSLVMLMLGIISEYVGLIYEEVKRRPNFVVRDVIGLDAHSGQRE